MPATAASRARRGQDDAPPGPQPPDAAQGGVLSLLFDGEGGARAVDPRAVAPPEGPPSGQSGEAGTARGFLWQHLSRDDPGTLPLLGAAGIDGFVQDALLAGETRPRCTVHGDGALLNLRGVNAHPAAEPGDMISVRFWLEAHRVIGVSPRPLDAIGDILASIPRGLAPRSPGELVSRLALRLADRAEPAVADLDERMDAIEEQLLDAADLARRTELGDIRRSAIRLRRYLVPQRDALDTLEIEDLPWLTGRDRSHLREAADRVLRLGEDLDAIRDRAAIVHDELLDQRAESLNRRMLLLTVVAAIFLPLSLITGLLGVNVGGIPGADAPGAFAVLCALLVAIGLAMLGAFRSLGMFR
jgi:zinc transporter